MTIQLHSVISIEGGDVFLSNVSFVNVQPNMASSTHAIILQTQDCSSIDQCGSLSYKGGIVEYMNNGYEIESVPRLNPFLWVNNLVTIEIEGISFRFNAIYDSISALGLINLASFFTFSLTNCTFASNFLYGSLLSVASSISFPGGATPSSAEYYSAQHISIKNVTFRDNYSMSPLIRIVMTGDLLNVAIDECTFKGNNGNLGLIDVDFIGTRSDVSITGLKDANGKVIIPPRYFSISRSSFVGHGSFSYLINVEKHVNIAVSDVVFERNGSFEPNSMKKTIQKFVDSPNIYATKIPEYGADVDCFSLITLRSITNSRISHLNLTGNKCTNGAPGVNYIAGSGANVISNFTVSDNISYGTCGFALTCSDSVSVSVSQLTAMRNRRNLNGVISLKNGVSLLLTDSLLESNEGYSGAGIYSEGVVNLTVLRTRFRKNNSSMNTGGALYLLPYFERSPSVTIQDCEFSSNTAQTGGAIEINFYSTADPLLLRIERTLFDHNSASVTGASLHTTSIVAFADSSRIDGCSFMWESGKGGAVTLTHLSGNVTISNSLFRYNRGEIASCVNIQTESQATVILSTITFEKNTIGPAVAKPNSLISSVLITTNCRFIDNSNGSVYIEKGRWTDDNSQFLNTSATAVRIIAESKGYLTGSKFSSNASPTNGGGVYMASKSFFSCSACLFVNNTSGQSGGGIFYEQDSEIRLSDCIFEKNFAVTYGSGVSAVSSNFSQVTTSVFRENTVRDSGTISIQGSLFALQNSLLDSNTATNSAGVVALLSAVWITNDTFRSQTGMNSPFLTMIVTSTVVITESSFNNGSGVNSGCFLMSDSTLNVTSSVISDVYGVEHALLRGIGSNSVSFSRVTGRNMKSNKQGSLMILEGSLLKIANSDFRNFSDGGIIASKMVAVGMSDSRFEGGSGTAEGVVRCLDCGQILIDSCVFSGINSTKGVLRLQSTPNVVISNSNFTRNIALQSCAISAIDLKMNISKCRFEGNIANTTDGGGVGLDCSDPTMCAYRFDQSEFVSNVANRSGGAIAWQIAKPAIVNTTFTDNNARYGPDVASFPIKLQISTIDSRTLQELTSAGSEIPPGQPSGVITKAALIDHYGQVVTTDSVSLADIATVNRTEASVSGITEVTAEKGVFTFSDLVIFADPGAAVELIVVTGAIPGNNPGDEDEHHQTVTVGFRVRECIAGESIAVKSCLVCQNGTYSVDPAKSCQNCLSNTKCLGMAKVIPESGYWRSGMYSEKVWECPQPSSCLGGNPYDNGTVSVEGFCSTGYKSNMCQSCADEYSRTTKNKCTKCPPLEINIVRIVFVAIAVVLFNAYLLFAALKSATRLTALHSIYMKILVNYTQLVFLVTEFNLNWPKPVLDLFSAQENTGGITEQIYSVDCFLAGNGDTSNVFYRKMLFMALLPVGVIAAIVLFWLLVAAYNKGRKKLHIRRKLAATIVIAFFFIHPTLTKSLFSMFSCTEINSGEYWLTVDMSIRCYDSDYYLNVFLIGIPAVVLWVFAVPLVCLAILIKYRKQQDELWIKLQYGFLISGYRRNRFYWEFVVLFRKIAIICCSVFLTNSIQIQALTVQMVLLFFYLFQHNINPYTHPKLNSTESKGIIVADVTIYCGLYYLTNDLSESTSWLLFVLIVSVNSVFLAYWFSAVVDFYIDMVALAVPAIGRVIRPRVFERDPYIESFITSIAPTPSFRYDNFPISDTKTIWFAILRHNPHIDSDSPFFVSFSQSYNPMMPEVVDESSIETIKGGTPMSSMSISIEFQEDNVTSEV